ncbi:MAG: ubiquinol-cytochrome C chaperone family protein [Pirellulaceae bacterium]
MPPLLTGFTNLTDRFRQNRQRARTATEIYGRLVTLARSPGYYSRLGIPDTPEGRLEMVLTHVVLILLRLRNEPTAEQQLAQAIAERFVTDVDDNMREMGVSDIKVPQKVKKAAAALYDRTRDYAAALQAGDDATLARLLATHLLGSPRDATLPPAAYELAELLRAQHDALAKLDIVTLQSASFVLPGPDPSESLS